MDVKILIIGNILNKDSVLLRKKFEGSEPYKETWYSFGCDFIEGEDPEETFKAYLKNIIGIEVITNTKFFWDTEVKKDYDGVTKQFIYLNIECNYVSGEPIIPKGHEKISWVPIKDLSSFDIVPPSVEMFKSLKYLN